MSSEAPAIAEVQSPDVLEWLNNGDIVLVDVRETVEYEAEHIPGALLCPLSTFEADLFPKFPGKRVVIHCAVGKRSAAACKQLMNAGYAAEVVNLEGGINAWKTAGCPTEVQAEARDALPYVGSGAATSPLEANAHPGRILEQEFLWPFGLTQSALATAVQVPTSRINAIVRGRRGISAETAMRLARHLCTTEEFWLRLQAAYDLAQAETRHRTRIDREVAPRRTVRRA